MGLFPARKGNPGGFSIIGRKRARRAWVFNVLTVLERIENGLRYPR